MRSSPWEMIGQSEAVASEWERGIESMVRFSCNLFSNFLDLKLVSDGCNSQILEGVRPAHWPLVLSFVFVN